MLKLDIIFQLGAGKVNDLMCTHQNAAYAYIEMHNICYIYISYMYIHGQVSNIFGKANDAKCRCFAIHPYT